MPADMNSLPRVFCAIDTPDTARARDLIAQIAPTGCGIKLGLEFFNYGGPQSVRDLMEESGHPPFFLDLKYHDIPNTVASAIKSVTRHFNPAFLNVHAAGGYEMMARAREACPPDTKLLAVTILTSLDEQAITQVGYQPSLADRVVQMAELTRRAGLDGVVCSSHEIQPIRETCGDDFILMVPGIRPAGTSANDQKRMMTPKQAVDAGATHLVIGRPITQADRPAHAARDILTSLIQ